jgi:histidinol phosphatase-like enzyme
MGRYANYMKDIWAIQANRKVIGLTLFGVLFDNSKPFTPGQQLTPFDDTEQAIRLLSQKGYDFLIIAGQPPQKTRNLDITDFENILGATRDMITQFGGRVKNAYYAPGTDKNDPYVKPNTGMFERAQNEGMVKWADAYYIGVEAADVKAATKIKATPILIKTDVASKIKAFELTHQIKVKEFNTLFDFAQSLE